MELEKAVEMINESESSFEAVAVAENVIKKLIKETWKDADVFAEDEGEYWGHFFRSLLKDEGFDEEEMRRFLEGFRKGLLQP